MEAAEWYKSLILEARKRDIEKGFDHKRDHPKKWGPLESLTRRRLILSDLYYLMVGGCGAKYMWEPLPDYGAEWVFQRAREVQKAPDEHLDLWAREQFKSTLLTFGHSILDILRDPEVTIGIFSHTRPIAKKFLEQIKRELESNEDLIYLFPDVLYQNPRRDAIKWSADEGFCVRRKTNPKEMSVEAWGLVDGQPTSRHFAILLYDDVVTLESVTTPEQVAKTTTAFRLSTNLGKLGGRRRMIGTRYAMRDTYHDIIEAGIVTPRIYPATVDGKYDGDPVMMTPEQLNKKKKEQGAQFAAQMLQNPMAGHETTFDVAWLKACRWEVRPRTLNVYILCDPSMGKSRQSSRQRSSDRTAMPVVGIDAAGNRYLLDGFCHRMQLLERWERLKELRKKWMNKPGVHYLDVGYERYGMQSDLEFFEERMRVENEWFEIREVNWPSEGGASKAHRVGRLQPYFREGEFFLPCTVWHDAVPDEKGGVSPGTAYWRVSDGQVRFVRQVAPTRTMKQFEDEGFHDLVAKPIRQRNEAGELYDLTREFLAEYEAFPFGLHDDLIDAVSRIHDMDAREPTMATAADLSPALHWDT